MPSNAAGLRLWMAKPYTRISTRHRQSSAHKGDRVSFIEALTTAGGHVLVRLSWLND
jgi:hypothetical protein